MSDGRTEMQRVDVVLRAYDVLEAVMVAETLQAAADAVRADLQVLPPDVLLRVATAVTVEAGRRLQTPESAAALRRRLEHARVETMWAASDAEAGS